ncbi:protein kinase [Streptomyces sp. NPDC056224]|uniref:serine/threonine-protein kinase n=1 Tax=Streptomyces sp. NPDC056224 TaxID=3345750 RepID=UPI0035D95337
MEELEPGDPRQLGRYRIVARLGSGGMGRVYLARSVSGRALAVKVVRAELAEDAEFRRRFAREVEAARRVTGFFTAAVVDADPEGTPAWLATAYVEGMSLQEAVQAHGAWPQRSVLALGTGLGEALEAIHRAGLVHRDLKPSNILLAADGPRVIDFGISVGSDLSAVTQTAAAIGTPGFMSPEQVRGEPVGPAADVFALGGVLAYAATGSGPFGTGSAHSVNFRAVYEEPDLTGLPPGLEVIGRCLVKEPGLRPAVSEVVSELAQALGTGDSEVTPTVTATAILTERQWLPEAVAVALPTAVTEQQLRPAALTGQQPLPTAVTEQQPRPAAVAGQQPLPMGGDEPGAAATVPSAGTRDASAPSPTEVWLTPGATAFLDQLQATRDAGGSVQDFLLTGGAVLPVADFPALVSHLRSQGLDEDARTLLVGGAQRRSAADVAMLVHTLRGAGAMAHVSAASDSAAVIRFCAQRMTSDLIGILGDLDGLGMGPLKGEVIRAAARHRFPGRLDLLVTELREVGRRRDADEVQRQRRQPKGG